MAAKQMNIVPKCRIQVINETTWKYQTLGETLYTPKHINEALKKLKLTSAWICWEGEREFWHAGKEIASQ